MAELHIGGSFAPPLSDAKLSSYSTKVQSLPPGPVKDAIGTLLHCCKIWWDLPEPEGTRQWAHPVGRGTIVQLKSDHAAALDPHIPWKHEIEAMQRLFDTLPTGTSPPGEEVMHPDGIRRATVIDPEAKALRDMAFHLLWHVIELDIGREPLTTDKL